MQPFCLPQFEDLAVVQSINFVLEELQGGRLTGQRPGDLLPHHLHHLGMETWRQSEVTYCAVPCRLDNCAPSPVLAGREER